MITTSNVNWF